MSKMTEDKQPTTPEERSLETAAPGANELVIVPATSRVPPDEFRVFVRVDEPENTLTFAALRGTEIHPSADAIDTLQEHLGADKSSRILITPDDKGWTLAELPKDRDEGVLVSSSHEDDELNAVARLYRAIGCESHPEDADWEFVEKILADDDLRVLVLPPASPATWRRDLSVKDLVDALFSIADSIADMPGDPGRTVDLPARARAIREASDVARKGRR